MRAAERIGKRYNWLTVIDFYRVGENGHTAKTVYICRCKCGNISHQRDANLFKVKSCGCYARSRTTNKVVGRPEYAVWIQMNQRCYNKRCRAYKNYGARGVMVCEAWRAKPGEKNATAFRAFLKHVGSRPKVPVVSGRSSVRTTTATTNPAMCVGLRTVTKAATSEEIAG